MRRLSRACAGVLILCGFLAYSQTSTGEIEVTVLDPVARQFRMLRSPLRGLRQAMPSDPCSPTIGELRRFRYCRRAATIFR
jgi:hypothetical protein